jgi:hypothetical protein
MKKLEWEPMIVSYPTDNNNLPVQLAFIAGAAAAAWHIEEPHMVAALNKLQAHIQLRWRSC